MANDSYTQQALAVDPNFTTRVRSSLSTVAWQVMNEAADVAHHAERAAFARSVIANVDTYARQYAPWLVTRPNLIGAETSYNFQAGAVVTAATDAALESQLMSDWDDLAGVVEAPPA